MCRHMARPLRGRAGELVPAFTGRIGPGRTYPLRHHDRRLCTDSPSRPGPPRGNFNFNLKLHEHRRAVGPLCPRPVTGPGAVAVRYLGEVARTCAEVDVTSGGRPRDVVTSGSVDRMIPSRIIRTACLESVVGSRKSE